MHRPESLENFEKKHPFPDVAGIQYLYKYFRFDDEHPEYLHNLLIENKLYHSLPENFNDPFECKPHWSWPKKPKMLAEIRNRLIKVAKSHGANAREASLYATNAFSDKDHFAEAMQSIVAKHYRSVRICSFTTSKENILLWSHYGDSHRGICVEFDSSLPPVASAIKIGYQEEYPAVLYPLPKDARGLSAMLTKAKVWEYENEFRSFLFPDSPAICSHDGESYLLGGNEITAIFLGAEISKKNRDLILRLIQDSNKKLSIFQAELSRSAFSIEFKLIGESA